MKARIRGTNVDVDVQPFYDINGHFIGFENDCGYYQAEDLLFLPDTPNLDYTDWSSFRREVAKDILPTMINWRRLNKAGANLLISKEEAVKLAIEYADELIKQLKQE